MSYAIEIAKLGIMFDGLTKQLDKLDQGLTEVVTSINTLEQKIENRYATKNDLLEVRSIQTDHEARTRSIEKSMWKQAGIASAIGAIIGILIPFLLGKL